jgi:8-oxo-dGTP diphosphatase
MEVVDQWTARHACALQSALRMTQDEFAEHLGVVRRTVATWHERPDIVLRPELQRALDTVYETLGGPARIRFVRQLDGEKPTAEVDRSSVALTVAIAIVTTDADALIVCRRDADPSGITWQFPAGIVKPGALSKTVAVREVLAETGIHCAVNKELGSRVHPLSGVNCEYFLCDYLAENVSVIWVPRGDVTRFIPEDTIFPPALQALRGHHG